MALRCLLVSLVATLGFELPSSQDVTSWTMSGRDWVSARTVDLSALGAEASGWLGLNDPALRPKTEVAATETASAATVEPTTQESANPADLAFDSIGEGMAVAFASDLETARAEEATQAPALVATEKVVTAQPEAEAERLALAFPALASTDLADGEGEDQDDAASARAERLSSAVRLTREAVQAWASVIQTVGDEAIPTR